MEAQLKLSPAWIRFYKKAEQLASLSRERRQQRLKEEEESLEAPK